MFSIYCSLKYSIITRVCRTNLNYKIYNVGQVYLLSSGNQTISNCLQSPCNQVPPACLLAPCRQNPSACLLSPSNQTPSACLLLPCKQSPSLSTVTLKPDPQLVYCHILSGSSACLLSPSDQILACLLSPWNQILSLSAVTL
jgi:hypothetical protein